MFRDKTNCAGKNADLDIRFIRALFVSRGDSLHAWSIRSGYSAMHVLRSVRGDYYGPKARRALDDLRSELGLK